MNPARRPQFRPPATLGKESDDVLADVRARLPAEAPIAAIGRDIAIAALDTWPTVPAAGAAKGAAAPARMQDPSVKRLFPKVKFRDQVDPAWENFAECRPMDCNGRLEDPMPLADHGLFVAGILCDMAPEAALAFYRVFNDNGAAGSMLSVAAAIDDAIAWRKRIGRRRLVINASLGFGPPLQLVDTLFANHQRALSEAGFWGQQVTAARQRLPAGNAPVRHRASAKLQLDQLRQDGILDADPAASPAMLRSLAVPEWIFDFTNDPDVLVVAATGNDSCPGHPPFGPRVPAADRGVLGVSAFVPAGPGERWHRANYSNDDDLLPNNDGIGAFGGSIDLRTDLTSAVVGSAPISYYRHMAGGDMGLAYWSGTSFATPIAAGFAAALWSAAPGREGQEIRKLIVDSELEYLDLLQSWP